MWESFLLTKTGRVLSYGDVEEKFSIQSISKVVSYLLVLENIEEEKIKNTIGIKPTSLPFNSVLDLEIGERKPRNPMVNAGAMASVALLYEKFKEETFNIILEKIRLLCGDNSIDYSEEIYISERDTAFNNRGMINMMAAKGTISYKLPLDEVANIYFKVCSIMVNAKHLARLSYGISNDGFDKISGVQVFDKKYGKVLRTIMAMAGMYDYAGEFAMEVGVPGKSGVGGGIIISTKEGYGIATYCPCLDEFGNSLVGIKILECISKELDLNIY